MAPDGEELRSDWESLEKVPHLLLLAGQREVCAVTHAYEAAGCLSLDARSCLNRTGGSWCPPGVSAATLICDCLVSQKI